MYNKKTLSKASAELDKAKAPKKPKDIITDPMGQWKYPGLPTRIPSNDITMKGVGYPVLGVANNGQRKIMLPGADYTFPGADYVDEYPQMRKGGAKKKKTKSLSGTNKLMLTHPLLRNYKNKVYDPNVDYFQDGGMKTVKSKDGTVTNRFINEAGDEVVQVKTKDGKYTEKVIPAIQQHKALRDIEKIIKVPYHQETEEEYDKLPADEKLRRFERTVDVNLGYPQKRAAQVAQDVTEPGNDPVDNIRHPFAGRYTAEAAYNARKKNASWAPDWLNKAGAWVDANTLGVGHEATTLFKDKRPWGTKLRESAEDIYNNAVGVNVGLSDRSEREKDMILINKSRYNKIPDGFGEERPFQLTNPKWTDPYDKKQDGGEYIETELTDDEIEEYRKGGYIVEDISVPELNQAQKGGFKPIPLPLDKTRSETIQRVSLPSRQAVLDVKNKPAADKALKKEKKEQQKFKDELWKKYKKLPLSEKISDRVGAFINDPLGMTSRALLGEQAYIPGMAQGLHDYENPEVREKYLKELGYTPGEFDASDIQNMINPGNWVTSITENTRKGNVEDAVLDAGLMILPHLPKGTISKSNIKSGGKLLKDDMMGYINKKNTPQYVNIQDQIDDIVKNSSFKTEDEALDYLKDLAKKENKNVFDLLETYSKRGFGFSSSNPWAAAEVIKSDLNPYISPYLYHGTSDARLKSILELGLDNSKGKAINTGGAMADVLGGGRTTAAGDMAYAKTFSELSADATKGKPVILRFKNKNKENLGFLGSHPAVKNKDIEYSFDNGKTWSNKPNFNTDDVVKAGAKFKNLKNYLNPKYSKASQIENTFIPNTLIQHPDNSYVLQNNSVKDFGITPEIKNLPTKDSHKFEVTKDEVKQLIDQNLEYLTHPNYIKRRQATTGESTKKIEKEINKYVENLKKTSIDLNNTRYGKKGYGAYLRSLKLLGIPLTKPKILINSSDKFFKTKSDVLHVLDHEIKHALSPVVESDFKALPKYKNYPHLNLVDKKTANSKYHSADDEQQVRFLRMKDYLHNKYGISKHEPISSEDWDLFKNDWNNWLKENHIVAGDKKVPRGMSDIKGMMELKDPKVTSDALRNLVNKAWVAAPATGMFMMQNSQNKKQKGGVVAELSDDEIQDYINQGYVVEEVDEPKMQVGGESDLDSQIEAYKQKLELIKSRRAQNPIQETVVETPVKAAAVPVPSSNSVVQQVVVKKPVLKQSVVKEIVKPKKENPIVKTFEKSKIKQEVRVKTEDTKQKLEKFTKDTLAKIKNQIVPTAVPEPNIVNMYKNNYQKHLNSIITDPSKSKNLFNNNQLEKEIMDRQYIDNVRYGRFDKRGDDVMNRTDFKRNVDSEKYLADIAEDNSVIIDIGSALGNNDPKLSGVSVFELASNPKIKQKNVHVIATDIASGVKDFKTHVKNKTAYNIDYAEVPMNFKTPISKILKDKKLSDKENIYLRTANSIDLLMNVDQAKEHLNHIAKSLKEKTVTYLYNNVILYKPKGKTTFQKLGNINNAGYDHNNKSWLTNKNRTPYKLTKPPLR